jgi:hypothetical protein
MKGIFTKESLTKKLNELGVKNPDSVIREAEKGRAIVGEYRIMAVR